MSNSINVMVDEEFYADEDDEGPDVVLMTEQLRIDDETHNLILMKDGDGNFYNPEFGFTNIPFWDVASGYQIKLREDAEAMWSGVPIPADAEINMEEGWNLVAYFPIYELSAEAGDFYVLSTIIDDVLIAKDSDGNFMRPAFNFSNMPPWRKSQGYQVKVEEDVVLTYPEEADDRVQELGNKSYPIRAISPVPTGENMSVLVENLPMTDTSSDFVILAYSEQGVIVGTGYVSDGRSGLAVWGDDPTTEEIDGLEDDESFELYYSDLSIGIETRLSPDTYLKGTSLNYMQDGFIALTVEERSAVILDHSLVSAYPNPFNSTTSISYGITQSGDVSLKVYNLSGQQISTLFEGHRKAGTYSANLTADNLPSGLYLVKLEASDEVAMQKVMLIR